MFSCPNCGNNIRFDIASQKMHCPSCDTYLEPASLPEKTRDAETGKSFDGEMEVTIYTCPQCGAELLSTDQDATSFCSYCGASNILTERLSYEKRPDRIIPFRISKEECKKAYARKMRHALFAPSELKKAEFIDGFRGIYMPYWSYDMEQKGNICIDGLKSRRRGDYIIEDHYKLSMDADNSYKGVTHDASSTFSDHLSEAIAPYDTRETLDFHTAYLSGFYADTADIDSDVYRKDEETMVAEETGRLMEKEKAFLGYSTSLPGNPVGATHTRTDKVSRTLFPVWFMSWRHDDRVAYTAVNGQTGKITADIPVDKKKYFIAVAAAAVLLFLLFNTFLVLNTWWVIFASSAIATVGLLAYYMTLKHVITEAGLKNDRERLAAKKKVLDKETSGVWLGVIVAGAGLFFGLTQLLMAFPAGIVYSCIECHKSLNTKKGNIVLWTLIGVFAVIAVVLFINPYQDIIYYGLSLILTVLMVACFMDVLRYHNQLITQPLPQFQKSGGDDNA